MCLMCREGVRSRHICFILHNSQIYDSYVSQVRKKAFFIKTQLQTQK